MWISAETDAAHGTTLLTGNSILTNIQLHVCQWDMSSPVGILAWTRATQTGGKVVNVPDSQTTPILLLAQPEASKIQRCCCSRCGSFFVLRTMFVSICFDKGGHLDGCRRLMSCSLTKRTQTQRENRKNEGHAQKKKTAVQGNGDCGWEGEEGNDWAWCK